MPELPHGWRVRNSEGEKKGPPVEEDGAYFSGSDSEEGSQVYGIDIKPDSEGWDDVEDDTEEVSIKCLLCDATFPTAKVMIEHSKEKHEFDFAGVQTQHSMLTLPPISCRFADSKQLDLDFYQSIKLVNYIRSEVLAGKQTPDVSTAAAWSDDKYLQPTLEDDALLFNLDEIDERPVPEDETVAGAPSE
jgi:hypothetical protein